MKIMEIVFCFISFFIIAVFLVVLIEKCSIKEATIKCRNFVWDIVKYLFAPTPQPELGYPLYIGFDGYKIVPDLVDGEFREIEKNFDVCYCDGSSLLKDGSCIRYRFPIQRKKDTLDDRELSLLVQRQIEKIAFRYLQRENNNISAETVTLVELQPNFLYVAFALNQTGIEHITNRKRILRRQMYEKVQPKMMVEDWGRGQMFYGYLKKPYENENLILPIKLPIESHCNALFSGASGSGKSQALTLLMGCLLQERADSVDVWICDFKKMDFVFLEDYSNYYSGKNCFNGVMEYYKIFTDAREHGRKNGKRSLLIFDEYPAFINHLQMQDKINKTKEASEILGAIAEILMMARGLGFGIWIVTQRADSLFFNNGARDNFMITCVLGRISKEQKTMLFAGEDLPEEKIYGAGEGLLLADGHGLMEVKFPLIKDLSDWQNHIRDILIKADEIGE